MHRQKLLILNHQYIFRFQDFLYLTLYKEYSQLCYERYNKMIWYTILLYVVCVWNGHKSFFPLYTMYLYDLGSQGDK